MWKVGDIVYRVNKREQEIIPYKIIRINNNYNGEFDLYHLENCLNGIERRLLRKKDSGKTVTILMNVRYFENVEEAYNWLCEK